MFKHLIILLLSGCTTYQAGIAYHHEATDAPEVILDNPLGIIRGKTDTDYGERFCEHVSGIEARENGYGFNYCGYFFNF